MWRGFTAAAVSTEQLADFALERPVGSWRGYVTEESAGMNWMFCRTLAKPRQTCRC